ncbi:argininosuccinate lyase/amino-acid N-acetyltransferase [Centipeda periodontii DSM 2778]|uniref:Argininosuccinate lyase/amino-acid N-acetyltransferase n=1 Tax=Centipeda periodontii DSM 2778 TaxID=888060 RepID=F5RMI4_9FIRM|nr:N-acetyltransferase [Centipeda periodontii]EGK59875.1 argininosuccinate lyase/amino-acid N-acetyltransferase [Centipeda periodontii DSM 2778]
MIYRKARFDDIESIYGLVNIYAAQGEMLPRSRNTLYENLRDMVVAEEEGRVIGVGALHIMWDRLAEVRMMAIAPEHTRQGIGAEIVQLLLNEGDVLGIEKVFTLTYKPDFFRKLGFIRISREELPQKVWKECIDCPKYPNCDEIAMIKV